MSDVIAEESSWGQLVLTALLVGWTTASTASCADPEPKFGDPSGIIGKRLPNEQVVEEADVFGGAYSAGANKPATTLRAAHQAKSGPAPETVTDCMACHKTGGQAAAKPFSFGGRILKNTPDVDVVVFLSGDKLGPVKSDADGFFWFAGAAIKDGAHSSVRSATKQSNMSTALNAATGGGCLAANCHASTTALGLPGSGL